MCALPDLVSKVVVLRPGILEDLHHCTERRPGYHSFSQEATKVAKDFPFYILTVSELNLAGGYDTIRVAVIFPSDWIRDFVLRPGGRESGVKFGLTSSLVQEDKCERLNICKLPSSHF